jgi:hypothetical protein
MRAATPSRDSHDVPTCETARHARAGRPRWSVDVSSPMVISASAVPSAKNPNTGSRGTSPSAIIAASPISRP